MTRLAPLILSVLLSGLFHSVDAKSKLPQIRMYQFTSDRCDGHPKGSNVDVRLGNCADVDGRSFRPRLDEKRAGWLRQLNHDYNECGLKLYTQPKCNEDTLEDMMALPEEIDGCYTSPTTKAVRSVRFVCQPFLIHGYNITSISETTRKATSWSIGEDHLLTPHPTTETVVVTTVIPVTNDKHVARRSAEEVTVKQNQQWVWMKHPWSGSTICYECFTKEADKLDWVKCFSRANEEWNCGPRPLTITTTEMSSTMTTVTESVVNPGTKMFTTTATLPAVNPLPSFPQPLQPRSWHKSVRFSLPWRGGFVQMCADAEWEKRGRPNTEIRLQEVHLADEKHRCDRDESLDLPPPDVETATSTAILTETDTLTGYTASRTVTTTIYTAVLVSTYTMSTAVGEPGIPTPSTTMWPTVYTMTTLKPTKITITTMVPDEFHLTTFKRDHDLERDSVPTHRDL